EAGKGGLGEALSGPSTWGNGQLGVRAGAYGLDANPGGPYRVIRGGRVMLDGSKSKPKSRIKSYEWSFSGPECDGVLPEPGNKSGVKISAVPLCDVYATLTVSDGEVSDSETTVIRIRKRKLRDIPFD